MDTNALSNILEAANFCLAESALGSG